MKPIIVVNRMASTALSNVNIYKISSADAIPNSRTGPAGLGMSGFPGL